MRPSLSELEKIDSLIRSGQGSVARRQLRAVASQKIDRAAVLAVAALARRAGVCSLSLRLLNPLVRPSGKRKEIATSEEKAEYAAALSFIGVGEEAFQILKNIHDVPQALLFQAFALFSQWDYGAAIELLNRYLQQPITDYQRLVGRVNLAAALVHTGKQTVAVPLLESLLAELKASGNILLYGNALELKAQNEITAKNWEEATRVLADAARVLEQSQSRDFFFVNKWQTIVSFLRAPHSKIEQQKLRLFRARALREHHWETVRHCDQFEAVALRSMPLCAHLYFGTPHPKFRERLLAEAGLAELEQREYLWRLNEGRPVARIDLSTGVIAGAKRPHIGLKPGQTLHRLLVALCGDFYRPLRVGAAYYALNPGDFYHPLHSPPRVYEAVRRLRERLRDSGSYLEVAEANGFYRLSARQPVAIRVRMMPALPRHGGLMLRVYEKWRAAPASVRDISASLGVSPRTTLRLLTAPENREWVTKLGAGPTTRYQVMLRVKP